MAQLQDFLQIVVERLDAVQIPYMVVGSVAASAHGNPRTTHDVDIVFSPTPQQLAEVVRDFQRDMYADLSSAQSAMRSTSMFNVLDIPRGLKADLIFLKRRPFDQMEFSRRQKVTAFGAVVWAATAEDVILSKLEWAKMGDSERQYRDAFAVASMQRDTINQDYLRRWAVELDVGDLLNRLLAELATAPAVGPTDDPAK